MTSEGFRAELIDGIVYVRESISEPHCTAHADLQGTLFHYRAATPGVQTLTTPTMIMGKKDEVEPDVVLRILPAYQGQCKNVRRKNKEFLFGAPELVAEVAYSSQAIDLHVKRQRYELAGVIEYLVVCLEPKRIVWFDLRDGTKFAPDSHGIFRSCVFPGLWLHGDALLNGDAQLLLDTLNRGLSSREHKAFVKKMKSARQLEY
jgi:Uma2 family endonuclease